VADGKRLRLKGKGGPGGHGGPAGDLFLIVHVDEDNLFGRRGEDVTLNVPISFSEAVLGADIEIPTVDGERVRFRVPPGTQSGRVFRLRNRGGPKAKGGRHDMLATVDVAVPSKLSHEQKEALERFAAASTDSPRAALWAGGDA
jgi:molecular chaperone DnaJ